MHEMREETRARISKAITTLGYVPNSAARQLKTGNAPILGLLVPSVVNPYFGELAVAVDAAAQERGFRVVLCNTQRNPATELSFVRELVAYGVRGILAASVLHLLQTGVQRINVSPLLTADPDWHPGRIGELDAELGKVFDASVERYERTGEVPLLMFQKTRGGGAATNRFSNWVSASSSPKSRKIPRQLSHCSRCTPFRS